MGFVEVNPRYREFLERQGLAAAGDFLALPALIVSGHPDRHVGQVALGTGSAAVPAFLKREHRVRWRDRLASAWAGFGLVSRSGREALTLRAAQAAGVGCPEWIAAGEDDDGRAFLLVRAMTGAVDLRLYLRELRSALLAHRRRFAHHLGEALARLHAAGLDHPDLYPKHILVDPRDESICFLDWQRSGPPHPVSWRHRERDLAALDATLATELATATERLACLRGYMDTAGPAQERPTWQQVARAVRRRSERCLRRRHVREERLLPAPVHTPGVYWLDGEALCVTREFWAELRGQVPVWLRRPVSGGERWLVPLPGSRHGVLVWRRRDEPLRWLWSCLRGRPLVAPEIRAAGALFRQQRQGLAGPRLLAFGQRHPLPWRTESFLLTEAVSASAADAGEAR